MNVWRKQPSPHDDRKKGFVRDAFETVGLFSVYALVVITFAVRPFVIPSGSMKDTLQIGDRILVNRFVYWFSGPKRGDVVVFPFPEDPRNNYIKRVVGLPGEVIEIRDGHIYADGVLVEEPFPVAHNRYVTYDSPLVPYGKGEVQVPQGRLFVLGDNSRNSKDSRFWGFVDADLVKGKAFFIYWPPQRVAWLKGR